MGAGASVGQFENCDQFAKVMQVEDCFSSPAPTAKGIAPSTREYSLPIAAPRLCVDIPADGEGVEKNRPPALLPHLRTLFIARARGGGRGEGSIPVQEFWDLVEGLFAHVLSDFDNTRLEMYLDVKTDNPVTWREANEYFTVQFKLLKLRQRDYWVGLKTLEAKGKYFWYNIKDDNSFWMTESETSQFVSCMVLPAAQRLRRSLAPAAARKDTPHASGTPIDKLKAKVSSPCGRSSPFGRSRGMTAINSLSH